MPEMFILCKSVAMFVTCTYSPREVDARKRSNGRVCETVVQSSSSSLVKIVHNTWVVPLLRSFKIFWKKFRPVVFALYLY